MIYPTQIYSVLMRLSFQVRDVLDPAEMVQNCVNWCSNNVTDGNELACGFFNFEVSKFIPNPWLMRIWFTRISLTRLFKSTHSSFHTYYEITVK